MRIPAWLGRWFDARAAEAGSSPGEEDERVDWPRLVPFLALHLACLAVLWVGWSPIALAVAAALYLVRMFAITAFYHRYFSHRAFRAARGWQLAFAVLAGSAVQRGPLWWAAHHRAHHRHADAPGDPHSPRRRGFLWSHVGWLTTRSNFRTRTELVPDLARFPELVFLDRFDVLVPALLGIGLFACGALLERVAPGLDTSGWQLFVWGFCVSTVVLYHATFTINSLAHGFGSRRYETSDDSRNNLWLALLTLGEGWHNNHHRYPGAVRQGHRAWELDPTWWALVLLRRLGIVRALRPLPAEARRDAGR